MPKLRDMINENCLGKLPSESMFKLNKETGKFESPKQRGIKEDVINEEYIESMNSFELANALGVIKTNWDKWKKGPLTEPSDIKPAQKELISWVTRFLKQNIR